MQDRADTFANPAARLWAALRLLHDANGGPAPKPAGFRAPAIATLYDMACSAPAPFAGRARAALEAEYGPDAIALAAERFAERNVGADADRRPAAAVVVPLRPGQATRPARSRARRPARLAGSRHEAPTPIMPPETAAAAARLRDAIRCVDAGGEAAEAWRTILTLAMSGPAPIDDQAAAAFRARFGADSLVLLRESSAG